jgi:hypothetical protein
MEPKIIAVYWSFNPDVRILKLSLRNLINDVNEIIIVDNGSKNIEELRKLIAEFSSYKINKEKLRRKSIKHRYTQGH